ncbi:glycoside hydrolase family 16 protein [Rhizoctonia solani]|uniref:Glycoside hydrolase family 16 protein n=2 Tax=Rhizoctonia solani TaxID=456999 RepID=A0A8H7IJR7_9AGAM|nr:glycoside hydrolase family 16 protein [Rhizoctonia solani]
MLHYPSFILLSFPLLVTCSLPILSFPGPIANFRSFQVREEIIGNKFYDVFNFQTFNDPTHGRVNYVDQGYAKTNNLTYASESKFVMRADAVNNSKSHPRGRDSIRVASKQHYEDSVLILDLTHMPTGCGTWPAFWTVTTSGRWPQGGEIDIIEGINKRSYNLASLHTTPGCNMTGAVRVMTGVGESNECDAKQNNNQGCGVKFRQGSFGQRFNEMGGGWFAMRRTEQGVSVWFWGRNDILIPEEVRMGSKTVQPECWGLPVADFPAENCDMKSHFGPHEIVFDLTFCGDWAGSEYPKSGCPGTCIDSHPTTARHPFADNNSTRSLDSPTMDAPKQGVLRIQSHKGKENVLPSGLPRLSVKKDPNQPSSVSTRKVSGSQPTLGAAALRAQVDTLRTENAKLRKEHQRELHKSQEKASQLESRVQDLVREKLTRDSEHAEAEREHRMVSQREAALRTALEKSESALKQLNERIGKLAGAERKLEDIERIHNDEKRKLTMEISSLQSQLEIARTTVGEHSARLRERDTSRRFETRARDLEVRIQERDLRIRELEEELATAEAQAQVYEGRMQVYDKRVKAYKERVRVAEQQARDTEIEMEALEVSQAASNEETSKELAYAKVLLERFAVAYGQLHANSQAKDKEIQALEGELRDKGRKIATLEQMAVWAEEEKRSLAEELGIQRDPVYSEWGKYRHTTYAERDSSQTDLDELVIAVLEGQREMRLMEVQKLRLFSNDVHTSIADTSLPSASNLSRSEELELIKLRAECATLREEQESLEQDLVDAAMEAEEHNHQIVAYQELQVEYASLEAEIAHLRSRTIIPNVDPSHTKAQAELSRLEAEHKQLQAEFTAYKQTMEETARAAAEHEARAVLLNGLQAREHSLREQMDALRTQIARLEKDLQDERENVKRAERRLVQAKTIEDELREDIDEMMEALDRADRYEEAYNTLVGEVVQLGLSDRELDKLQKASEAALGVSNANQKLKYVEEIKAELDQMAQKLAQTERERDQARAQGVDLRRELGVFQTVTGLNGWMDPSRSASTPPIRSMMTPPARLPSLPLERITETSAPNEGLGVTSNARPELRALGLGLPSARRPASVPAPAPVTTDRRISRALSMALEAENMTLTE